MADHVEVNTDILQSDINELEQHIQRIDNKLDAMFSDVEELNTLWKGQANDAFKTQFQKDYEVIQSIISELKEYINSLSQARQKYDKCESSVQDMIKSMQV